MWSVPLLGVVFLNRHDIVSLSSILSEIDIFPTVLNLFAFNQPLELLLFNGILELIRI